MAVRDNLGRRGAAFCGVGSAFALALFGSGIGSPPVLAQSLGAGFLDGYLYTSAKAVSGDGSTVVGYVVNDYTNTYNAEAFRWANGTLTGLGLLGPEDADAYSLANAVSNDGSVIVGGSTFAAANPNVEAVSWTDGVISGLGFLDPSDADRFSSGQLVSSDGSIVAGYGTYDLNEDEEAFRWKAGTMTGLGFLDPGDPAPLSFVVGMSSDGNAIAGDSTYDLNQDQVEAFRWSGGTMTGLGLLDPGDRYAASLAKAMSSDGTTVVGEATYDANSDLEAFRWNGGTMTGLGFLDPSVPGVQSFAYGVSADGSVVAGESIFDGSYEHEAFRWADGTMTGLGFLDPDDPDHSSYFRAMSSDGSVIAGTSTFDFDGGYEAYLWTAAAGMKSMSGLLSAGGVDVSGWQLQDVVGMSASGDTVVGNGMNPSDTYEAWIARLGPEPGLVTPAAIEASVAGLGSLSEAAADRLNSLLSSELDFARNNDCGGASACAFSLDAGNDGLAGTGTLGIALRLAPHLVAGIGGGYGLAAQDMPEGGSASFRLPTGIAFINYGPGSGPEFTLAANGVAHRRRHRPGLHERQRHVPVLRIDQRQQLRRHSASQLRLRTNGFRRFVAVRRIRHRPHQPERLHGERRPFPRNHRGHEQHIANSPPRWRGALHAGPRRHGLEQPRRGASLRRCRPGDHGQPAGSVQRHGPRGRFRRQLGRSVAGPQRAPGKQHRVQWECHGVGGFKHQPDSAG